MACAMHGVCVCMPLLYEQTLCLRLSVPLLTVRPADPVRTTAQRRILLERRGVFCAVPGRRGWPQSKTPSVGGQPSTPQRRASTRRPGVWRWGRPGRRHSAVLPAIMSCMLVLWLLSDAPDAGGSGLGTVGWIPPRPSRNLASRFPLSPYLCTVDGLLHWRFCQLALVRAAVRSLVEFALLCSPHV